MQGTHKHIFTGLVALILLGLGGCTNTTTFDELMASLDQKESSRVTSDRLQPAYAPIDPEALTIVQESQRLPELAESQDIGGGELVQTLQIAPEATGNIRLTSHFSPEFTHKRLPDYISQLMMKLAGQTQLDMHYSAIGVGHFVFAEETLANTHEFGFQLADYILLEGQKVGLSLVDLDLRALPQGHESARVFFRQQANFAEVDADFDHILTGTLIESAHGLQINARIVERRSRKVKATAQVTVPSFILAQVVS